MYFMGKETVDKVIFISSRLLDWLNQYFKMFTLKVQIFRRIALKNMF